MCFEPANRFLQHEFETLCDCFALWGEMDTDVWQCFQNDLRFARSMLENWDGKMVDWGNGKWLIGID